MTTKIDDYFGLCPQCVEAGDLEAAQGAWLNVERSHYLTCDKHQVFWPVGANLFSNWRDESPETWQENAKKLDAMPCVKARYLPETEAMYKAREDAKNHAAALFQTLSDERQEMVLKLLFELTGMRPDTKCPAGAGYIHQHDDGLPF